MEVNRYESDRTTKQKLALEWQKLKGLSWPKRFEYVWAYYKWHMVGIFVVCFMIYNLGMMIYNTQYDTVFSAIIANGATDGKPIAADFREYCGDTEKFHKYEINAGMYLTGKPEDYKSDQEALGIILGMVAGKDVDVVILPEFQMKNYADQGAFYEMKDLLTEEQIAAFGDDVGQYSLKLSNNEKLIELGCKTGKDAYLSVLFYVEDLTYVEKFIEYLLGD